MVAVAQPTSSADGVAWELSDLYLGPDDPQIDRDLESALQRARRFEATYRGKIEAGPTPALLLAALTELESLSEQMDRPAVYASLLHAAKTDDPSARRSAYPHPRTAHGHQQASDLFRSGMGQARRRRRRALIDHPTLAGYRHYLEQKRAWRPHYLSEPEEKILEEKSVTGRAAFVRLFDETVVVDSLPLRARAAAPSCSACSRSTPSSTTPTARCARPRRPADEGLAGKRPPADVHLQQPGPRPSHRLRTAPLRQSDGAAPPGQRDPATRSSTP